MLERLAELVNENAALVRRGRFLDVDFLVEVGKVPHLVRVRQGRVSEVETGGRPMRPWRFAIRAPAEDWARFWEPMPAPSHADIFAMTKRGVATIEGDLQPLMANLRYVKELLAAPRRLAGGAS